jgi:cell wall-associated NlpC family hydrolase
MDYDVRIFVRQIPRLCRSRRLPGLLPAALASAVAAGLVLAPSASANPPGPHDPIGRVTALTAGADGVLVQGWTFDPDARQNNVPVSAVVDGRTVVARTTTSIANETVQAKYQTGPTPGFALTVPVADGDHTVCVVAQSIGGAGMARLLRCFALPLGRVLSDAEKAAHSPVGQMSVGARSAALHVVGWASDPDYVARRATVVVYVDNSPAATVATTSYPAPRPAAAGVRSRFDVMVPVATGTHVTCVWAVNVGYGANKFLGCRTRDTRGPAGTDPVTTPALNKAVVAEAKRHIGQPYVWGAAGPKSFDCSGLVTYSYGQNGFTTPRVSQEQFRAARLIPAERAVPGDLVFYYDNTGDVYHVGIYLSPGQTVAAIDESRGVDYQTIWDPTMTSYGSLTHT